MINEREKVIKGIECCTADLGVFHKDHFCDMCPYKSTDSRITYCFKKNELMRDALSLLKAQEPRVMNAEELRQYLMVNENGLLSHDQWQELGQRTPLYIEFRRPDEYQVNWRTVEHLRPWAMESMFWDNYGKDRRCWTSRPTDEQRAAAPWEGEGEACSKS